MSPGLQKQVLVVKSWKCLAEGWESICVVWGACQEYMEMTGLAVRNADAGIFETCHDCLGGGWILARVAHNLKILGIYWCLVVNFVSC